jgi:hypothetical protein
MYKRVNLLFAIVLVAGAIRAQVVNVEQARLLKDSIGWSGQVSATYQSQHFRDDLYTGQARGTLQRKTGRSFWLFLGEAAYSASRDVEFANYQLGHVRYGYKLHERLRWEGFMQLQTNRPMGIAWRQLTGTGPRWRAVMSKRVRIYLGTVAMLENEEAAADASRLSDLRSSSYASVNFWKEDRYAVAISMYYQPLFSRTQDYRLLAQGTLSVAMGKRLRLQAEVNQYFDSAPPSEALNGSLTTSFGLAFELGGAQP